MDKKTIDTSIYVNIYNYKNPDFPFQIFVGGRGFGKTYSALKGAVEDKEAVAGKFVLMRRTQKELDFLFDTDKKGEGMNPFKKYNSNEGTNYGLKSINDNIGGIYSRGLDDSGKYTYEEQIGYAVALSTVAGIRGIDVSDATTIIYDEFIPEKHVKLIGKDGAEFDALMNAYETMNRNRELEGEPPMDMYLLSNANDIYNPIFVGLKLVDIVEKMKREGKTDKYIKERGLAIHLLPDDTKFTELKSKTALYKLTAGTKFNEMSLHNDFAFNDFSLIGYKQLTGYRPLCHVDNMYIYRKKGSTEFYICKAAAKCPGYDSSHEQEVKKFMQKYGLYLRYRFIDSDIIFETFDIKTRILDIIT